MPSDYEQWEIDGLTQKILQAQATGGPVPRTFTLNGKYVQKFNNKDVPVHLVCRDTKRLYCGTCEKKNSVDYGKQKMTLAKKNPAHQKEAQDYALRQLVLEPQTLETLLTSMKSAHGRRDVYPKIMKNLLQGRFDMCLVSKFMAEEQFSRMWDVYFFPPYAKAFSDLFNGTCS